MTTDIENTPNTEAEVTAELAKPEDASLYIEQREADEADARPPEDEVDALAKQVADANPELQERKKASSYERLKRARDQYKREADELRSRLGQSAEPREAYSETESETQAPSVDTTPLERSLESAQHMYGDAFNNAYRAFVEHCQSTGDQASYQRVMNSADPGAELVQWHNEAGNPSPSPEAYEAAIQQGRQEQELQQHLAARDEEIRVQTEARLRSEAFAAQCADFHETIQSVEGVDDLPPLMIDLIRRSNVGPEIAYLMAKDFWDTDSKGIIDHARELANDPIAQARFVGNLEQAIMYSRGKGSALQTAQPKHLPR